MSIAVPSPDTPLLPRELEERLAAEGILAVLTIDEVAAATPLARALVDGGIRAIELAWRTPATLEVLAAIRRDVPELLVGIGTILCPDQLKQAQAGDAAFGVSPGLSPVLLEAARALGFPYAPGVMTPSDVQVAVSHGCRLLKFFPAESSGGLAHLRNIHTPFAHLKPRYIALGGLNENNAAAYLAEPAVAVLGGSWIAPRDLIGKKDWAAIRQRARRARELVDGCRTAASAKAGC
jgi:2-dehydro-3-deoxyphosphogluconate aldolase/(4S)-4-hydroxy-2-oxoglutarate aldolase